VRIELFGHVVEASTEERIPVNDSEQAYEILSAYTAAAEAGAPRARQRGTGLSARISNAVQVMHIAWGTAWVVGYGLLFLRDSPGGRTFVPMPSWLPLTVLFVLLAGAGATTAVLGARVLAREAADEHSARQVKWYGTAWLLGFAGLLLTVGKLTHGLSADATGLLWGATTTGLVGALHMAGSAIWGDRAQFRMGIWVTFINVMAVMAGPGWQALILSIAGGGVFLLAGARGWLRNKESA
jgi:hypothetical protein